MEEVYVNYETALLAKVKGFNAIDCTGYYHENEGYKKGYSFCYSDINMQSENAVLAPTQALLQKWLRDKKIDITVITNWKKGRRIYYVGFSFLNTKNEIDIWFSNDNKGNKIEYDTYEEALNIGEYESLQRVFVTVA